MTYDEQLADLAEKVMEHATKNYETDGWDIVVETMDTEMITIVIRGARSEAGAIKRMAEHVGVIDSVRSDVMATAF